MSKEKRRLVGVVSRWVGEVFNSRLCGGGGGGIVRRIIEITGVNCKKKQMKLKFLSILWNEGELKEIK